MPNAHEVTRGLAYALSTTDARCIATASHRDQRLLTDDGHVGTVAQQLSVEVWDLVLLLQAAIRVGAIADSQELTTVLDALAQKDNYQFSDNDRNALFDQWEP